MNNGYIESTINTPITLPSNDSVITFQNDTRTRSTQGCNGWLCHAEGSPIYKIVQAGNYEIDFSALLFSGTAGTVAVGLFVDRNTCTIICKRLNSWGCGIWKCIF